MNREKNYIVFTIFAAFIYLLIISLQGFDLCDEGWCLSFYQQFFHHPDSAQYQFMYYSTGLIGGIWHELFGWGGILSFRILNIFVILSILYFTYQTVKSYLKPMAVPIAAFIMIVLLTSSGITVFHHNFLTSLLVAVAVLLLLQGINKNKKWFLFLGGLFVGLSFFSRIANTTMLALGILFLIDWLYEKNWQRFFKYVLVCCLGCLAGICCMVIIMNLLGHSAIFISCLNENLFSAGSNEHSNHNLKSMFMTYLRDYKNLTTFLILYFFLFAGFIFSYRLFENKKVRILLTLSMFILFMLLHSLRLVSDYYSFVSLGLLISCCIDYRNKQMMLLNTAAIIVMFFLPLGSDFGFGNMGGTSLWLATFLAVGHFYRFASDKIKENDCSARNFLCIVVAVFFITYLGRTARNAYFDPGLRVYKYFKIDHKLANTFTTKEKAVIMDDLLKELKNYVKEGDSMLCFESLPTIHYLTQTVPFMGTSWVWVFDPDNFEKNLLKAENSANKMPVVLRQKCQPIGGTWTVSDPRFDNTTLPDDYFYKKKRVETLNGFLFRNHYQIVWENNLFQILVSN